MYIYKIRNIELTTSAKLKGTKNTPSHTYIGSRVDSVHDWQSRMQHLSVFVKRSLKMTIYILIYIYIFIGVSMTQALNLEKN